MLILVWEALGFRLAYAKGQFGATVSWIGGTVVCEPTGIRVTVKASILSDIVLDLRNMIQRNVISHKDLRSTVGKLNHAAGLLVSLRPFMESLWAALNSKLPEKPGCTWRKQILPALTFFLAFFTQEGTHLERFFSLESFRREGPVVEIGTDASPWGLGGWIAIDGIIKEFFACQVSDLDLARFGQARGCHKGQQLWECLAILVAVDLWPKYWDHQRVVLRIAGDNVTALTMVVKMRPDNAKMAIIARDLALRLAKLSFPPDAMHVPGVSHKIADRLSRVYQPGETAPLEDFVSAHPRMQTAVRVDVRDRDDAFYKALLREPAFYKAEGDDWDSWW